MDTAPSPSDPPPEDPTESASYSGTLQSAATGLDDGDPPPGIETKTFAYNAANRLRSVARDGVPTMSYRYTGHGERVHRSGSGQTVTTIYDDAGRWLGEYDEAGAMIQQVIWLNDLPVGLLAGIGGVPKLHYIEADALGTPRVIIDPARTQQHPHGTVVWRWDLTSEPFGDSEPNVDPDGDNTWFVFDLRFPGQQYDSATGFNYNYFRDYDAVGGRYVQSDPIGLAGGISTYGYVGGSPLVYADLDGLFAAIALRGSAQLGRFTPGLGRAMKKAATAVLAGAMVALGYEPNGRLVNNLSDSIGDATEYSPIPRQDMTKLEERQFDRYCVSSDDPCGELKKAARAAILAAQPKMNNMLIDRGKMYGTHGWTTHAIDLQGRLDNIAAIISLGQKLGCDMSEEIALATTVYLPEAPR
jgi:RHS repeat-associated protein